MRKGLAVVAALVAALSLAGCSQDGGSVISGSVSTVYEKIKDLPVDGSARVEVTGYILGDEPAKSIYGSKEHHSTLHIYDGAKESEPYFIALFEEQPDELNDLIQDSTSTSTIRRVTVTADLDASNYGVIGTPIDNCEIKFDRDDE